MPASAATRRGTTTELAVAGSSSSSFRATRATVAWGKRALTGMLRPKSRSMRATSCTASNE